MAKRCKKTKRAKTFEVSVMLETEYSLEIEALDADSALDKADSMSIWEVQKRGVPLTPEKRGVEVMGEHLETQCNGQEALGIEPLEV